MPLLSKGQRRSRVAVFPTESVRDIEQDYGQPAKLFFNDQWNETSCLKCSEQYCMRYIDEEISCPEFSGFSYERHLSVCPTDAISWDRTNEMPTIDNEKCIECGLCAARCPVGAIYSNGRQMAIAETSENCIELSLSLPELEAHKKQLREIKNIAWRRHFKKENDAMMLRLYQAIGSFDGRSMIPNILVRNLIIALGYNCAISRSGDVYTRMDAVYAGKPKWNDTKGAIEIEFGRDTLDASRGILDDIAVLHSRSNIDKNENAAIVVCLSFPNKRQGYFQVIKDINRVLDLKIQTLSLGALLLLVWNGAIINLKKREFYVDFDNMTIRDIVENHLGRSIDISEGLLGILEPEK